MARFALTLGDDKGTESFEIKIPRDPVRLGKDAHRTLHWAVLPKPIPARCAQLVLLSSYRGAQAQGRRDDIAIAEVHLLSAAELSGQLDAALHQSLPESGNDPGGLEVSDHFTVLIDAFALEFEYLRHGDDVPLDAVDLLDADQPPGTIFLPFLLIDIVVASILMSMGMLMLPPVLISLPLKLLLFVLVDGWTLVVGMLLESFQPFT